ncbi:hypothetical protein L7F22_032549 [Adiantum nelumboides]|nr:hypothetical protein [Adiantum nelumboides]
MAALRVASVHYPASGALLGRRMYMNLPIAAPISSVPTRRTILVAETLAEGGLKILRKAANVDCSHNLSPTDLCVKMSLCDALIVGNDTMVTRQLFEASQGRLKVVGKAGADLLNVDVEAATEFGCQRHSPKQ